MHTATVVGSKMFVFGGVALGNTTFKYLDELLCFDLGKKI
jgi:hypothetical protein